MIDRGADALERERPLLGGPVVVRQGDPMRGIPGPIHDAERLTVEPARLHMILDDDGLPGDSGRLLEEPHRVIGVMQHVDQENDIDGHLVQRQGESVEFLHRDMGPGANEDVHAGECEVRAQCPDRAPEQAVTAPHIEHRRIARQQGSDMTRQYPDTSTEDEVRVQPADQAHRRLSPRMLKKKLESTVCKPSADEDGARNHPAHRLGIVERPEVARDPLTHCHSDERDPGNGAHATGHDAALEVEDLVQAVHPRVFGEQALA